MMLNTNSNDDDINDISMNPDGDVDTSTATTSMTTSNEDDINDISMDITDNESDIQIDSGTVSTDNDNLPVIKQEPTKQDSLYNHYNKIYPELFTGTKLTDIEGAEEKGIISQYSYVPLDDNNSEQYGVKPQDLHESTIVDKDSGDAYYYLQSDKDIDDLKQESIDDQMGRFMKKWNAPEDDTSYDEQIDSFPDAFGEYTTSAGEIVEVAFKDGKPLQDTSNLTQNLNEEGSPIVKDSLIKGMANIPGIGKALYISLMEFAASIDYVPAAFKDGLEVVGTKLQKDAPLLWQGLNASTKVMFNRSFKDGKDFAEQLGDGAGSFLEFIGSQGLASRVAGTSDLLVTRIKLPSAYVKAVKQVKKQTKDAKWLEGRLEKSINIERIKYATDVEMKGKADEASEIANANKGIRNELINSFEETTKKTVSKTDEFGDKTLDYEAARKAGLELLDANANPELVAKIAPRIDELTHPILKPEKLNGLVAVAKELQKKNPDAFNNKNTLIDNLFDLTVKKDADLAGSLAGTSGDELITLLNKYGLSFEDYILTVVGSGSQAGKVLNKLSQIKRNRPLSEAQLLAQKAAEASDSSIMNYAMRIENIRRGGLVSQLATAARNLQSGGMRAPLESFANVMDTALFNLSNDGYKAGAKSLLAKQNWKDSFSNLKYIFDDPKSTKELTDFILNRPELKNQYESLYNNLNEIQKVMGRGTGSTLDKVISKAEDGVSLLNTPNRWQEYLIRRGSYLGELRRLVRNEYKIDLLDELNAGKIQDLLNDSSSVRPKGARSFSEISADATKRALDVTYAKQPDVYIFNEISKLLTRSIVGTMVMPFPRFMFNSMELMGQYMGGGSLVMSKKLFSTIIPPWRGKLTPKDRQRISRNLVGMAAIGGFYKGYKFLSEKGESPTDYKMLPVGNGTVLDLTPLYPLRPYAYIGKAMEKLVEGTFDDWFDAKEFTETFLGTNVRTGVGNSLIEEMISAASGGGDLGTYGRAGKISGRAIGQYLSTWAVPYAQLLEAQRISGDRGTTYKDLAPEPTLDFGTNFMNEMERPFASRGFTDVSGKNEADAPKREFLFQDEKKRVSPASRVVLGLNLSTADSEDGEYLKDLGYVEFKLGSKSDSPKVRRFENSILRDVIPAIVDSSRAMEKYYEKEYKRTKVGFKETVTREEFMLANLKPIIDKQIGNIRQLLKDGKIGAGGPYVKAMTEYKRLPKGHRKWASIEFLKMSKDNKAADPTNLKDIQKITKIAESYGKALTKSLGSRK